MRYKFCLKISYVAQTKKGKVLVHDRGRNFDSIVSKLGINIGNIKIQVMFVGELCGTNSRGRTFLERNTLKHSKVRNFNPIVFKLGTKIGLV